MQRMLVLSERKRGHNRQETHQIILHKDIFYNVEGI